MDEKIKLTGIESKYVSIPSSIILNKELDIKRVVVYLYFAIKHGKDYELSFDINHLVKWCGFTPDKHEGKINDKIFKLLDEFEKMNFIYYDKPNKVKNKHSYIYTAIFMEDNIYNELNNIEKRFALIWIDEIKKIMNYKINKKSKSLNTSTVLLVFAYLRMMIYRRSSINVQYNTFREGAIDNPEAYNNFYSTIADELGISSKTLSSALNILSDELDLIYIHKLPVIKYDNNFRTDNTIFCNTYKREGKYLIDSGEGYYKNEIKNKIIKLKKYMKGDLCYEKY